MRQEPRADPYRRNVPLYYGFAFLMNFALWGGIWIKYLIDERGLELRWILAMDLPFWLLVALLQAPTGALADHIGRKRVLALGGLLYSATILGFGLTTNYWLLFADYILWAFAMSMQSGADSALVFDSLKQANRETGFQRVVGRGFAAQLIAGLSGVVLGGFLASATSLAFTVQISAVMPLLAMGCALAMREPPIAHTERHYWRGLAAGFRFAWVTPQVRFTLLLGAAFLTATFGPVVLVQPFLLNHDVSTGAYGLYQAPLRLTAVLAAFAAFRVGRLAGPRRLLFAGSFAMIAAYAGLAAFDTTTAFAFFGLSSLMSGLTRPMIDTYLNERIPSERRATVLSVMQLVFSLQVAFFEPALGFFTDGISLRAAFVFAAVYCALLMPPLVLAWRRADARGRPGEPGVTAPVPAG